ncbi:MAG: phosphotransferase [Rikenellaceae bacterium]
MKLKILLTLTIFATSTTALLAQTTNGNVNKVVNHALLYNNERTEVITPQVDGYVVLKGDFHLHTMFSDGNVWPTVRVNEAWRDGLDVIALTDHIEYRPNSEYTKGDLNTSFDIAKERADQIGMLIIKGIEITRSKPDGGHLNALFINDANKLDNKDANKQVDAAMAQGAFIVWNHPGWAIDTCKMFEPNERWIKEGKIHAIEIVNEKEYYPRATTWTKDFKLTPMACSDAHDAIKDLYAEGVRRPMTLIFSQKRDMESIKEALFNQQTLAMFDNQLAGNKKWLEIFFKSAIKVEIFPNNICVLKNICDLPISITSKSFNGTIPALSSVRIKMPEKVLEVKVNNFYISENELLETTITIN